MLYFAYGSNLSTPRLRVRTASARALGVAVLVGHRLEFHKVGRDGSAKCDAFGTGHPEDRVIGVVFDIEDAELPELDRAEGLGRGYDRTRVAVTSVTGDSVVVLTYCATRIDASLRPFHWYKEHVLRGAREHGLPGDYIEWIDAIGSIADPDAARHERELAVYRG